ncbi:transcriptional regulator, TetR family [Sphingobium faniae]|nr:transcriptional regulator, TetR family [Sphingobium faniae]
MKTQKAVNKKARILQAAAKVLADKGYSLTTLADIGSEAGTFAGSLYYYFPSKESIVEEVLNVGTTSVSSLVVARVEALPKGVSAYDRIRIALETHLQQMLAKDDFVRAYWKIIDQVPEDIRLKHLALPRAYGHFWQSMLEEAQAAGEIRSEMDPRMMRLLLIGSTIYALQWFNPGGRNTPKEIADLLAEMFFLGVVPRGLNFSNSMAFASPAESNPQRGTVSATPPKARKKDSGGAEDAASGDHKVSVRKESVKRKAATDSAAASRDRAVRLKAAKDAPAAKERDRISQDSEGGSQSVELKLDKPVTRQAKSVKTKRPGASGMVKSSRARISAVETVPDNSHKTKPRRISTSPQPGAVSVERNGRARQTPSSGEISSSDGADLRTGKPRKVRGAVEPALGDTVHGIAAPRGTARDTAKQGKAGSGTGKGSKPAAASDGEVKRKKVGVAIRPARS